MKKQDSIAKENTVFRIAPPLKSTSTTATGYMIFKVILVSTIASILYALTNLTTVDIFFVLFLLVMIIWNVSGKFILITALVFFVQTSVMLIIKYSFDSDISEVIADELAVWTYYFLAIGVLKQLWDTVLENKRIKVIDKPYTPVPTYIPKTTPTAEIKTHNRAKKIYAKHDVIAKRSSLVNTKEKQ